MIEDDLEARDLLARTLAKQGYEFIIVLEGEVEVRHLIRDPIDMTVAMLTNCGMPARFFGNHNMFLASQNTWIGRAAYAYAQNPEAAALLVLKLFGVF